MQRFWFVAMTIVFFLGLGCRREAPQPPALAQKELGKEAPGRDEIVEVPLRKDEPETPPRKSRLSRVSWQDVLQAQEEAKKQSFEEGLGGNLITPPNSSNRNELDIDIRPGAARQDAIAHIKRGFAALRAGEYMDVFSLLSSINRLGGYTEEVGVSRLEWDKNVKQVRAFAKEELEDTLRRARRGKVDPNLRYGLKWELDVARISLQELGATEEEAGRIVRRAHVAYLKTRLEECREQPSDTLVDRLKAEMKAHQISPKELDTTAEELERLRHRYEVDLGNYWLAQARDGAVRYLAYLIPKLADRVIQVDELDLQPGDQELLQRLMAEAKQKQKK
jgi:DNA-binding protein YbaB